MPVEIQNTTLAKKPIKSTTIWFNGVYGIVFVLAELSGEIPALLETFAGADVNEAQILKWALLVNLIANLLLRFKTRSAVKF